MVKKTHEQNINQCWLDEGLTAEGAARAEAALPLMEKVLRLLDCDLVLVHAVLNEVYFRNVELPKRTHTFQKMYASQNNMKLQK